MTMQDFEEVLGGGVKHEDNEDAEEQKSELSGLGFALTNHYVPGVAPRHQKGAFAFTSTEAPPHLPILPHTEMTYSNLRPRMIAFFAAQ